MTDKELLQLAAKAAGYWSNEFNCVADLPHLAWNPLTDDGDALRLSVHLNLSVIVSNNETECEGPNGKAVVVRHRSTPVSATRRAIVMVAAEIGRHSFGG